MIICAAQIQPVAGNIPVNIEKHVACILQAVAHGAAVIIFPELSITGYEPGLAAALASNRDDMRLDIFQQISDTKQCTICVGMPIRSATGIHIGMVLFQPGQQRQTYAKQQLHADELPYFVAGNTEMMFTVNNTAIAPAICYESLLPEHAAKAVALGAQLYAASVAKSATGVAKAYRHYPAIAKQYGICVVMSNSIGPCDNFIAAGQTATWNKDGELAGCLHASEEGLVLLNTITGEASLVTLHL